MADRYPRHSLSAHTYVQNSELDNLPVFGLSGNTFLEDIGTSDEDPDDFIALTERNVPGDYNELFQNLARQIEGLADIDKHGPDGCPAGADS